MAPNVQRQQTGGGLAHGPAYGQHPQDPYGSPPAGYGAPHFQQLQGSSPQSYGGYGQQLQGYGSALHWRAGRGNCCRCGQDFSAIAPHWDPRELFVNVTIRDVENHPVKNVQSFFAGVMGQVMGGGKNQFKAKISEEHFQENQLGIKSEVIKVFLNRGWHSDIQTMVLPPSRGNPHQSTHVQMSREEFPIFMVFRVQLVQRVWHGNFHCHCIERIPFHRLIDKREYDSISAEIEDALQQTQYMHHMKRPVRAEISVADAAEEMHVLYNMHWTEEQASDCIVQSRR